jgi:hypothetical protein
MTNNRLHRNQPIIICVIFTDGMHKVKEEECSPLCHLKHHAMKAWEEG